MSLSYRTGEVNNEPVCLYENNQLNIHPTCLIHLYFIVSVLLILLDDSIYKKKAKLLPCLQPE